jgi:fucose permease
VEGGRRTHMGARRHLEIGLVYLAGLAQGLALVTIPAAGNIFRSPEHHNLTSSEYGMLFLPMIVCAIASSSLGGSMARRWGLKRLFVAGILANTASMALLGITSAFAGRHGLAYAVLLGSLAALGTGFGATLTALNTYASAFFPGKSEAALTALHAVLGIGTALAPLFLVVFLKLGMWWGLPAAVGVVFLSFALLSVPLPLSISIAPDSPPSEGLLTILRTLPNRLYIYIGIVILYGSCETLIGNWATIYLHEGKGISMQWAGIALSVFWAMVTTGRVLIAVLSVWLPAQRIYLAMPVLISGALLFIPVVGGQASNVIVLGVAGLACSAFLPLSISFATQEFSGQTEAVSGLMMASFMMGYGLGAYGVGPVREIGGLTLSSIYSGSSIFAAIMVFLAFVIVRSPRPRLLSAA